MCTHAWNGSKDWWPCGCFVAYARKQVCSFVFHCHRQPLRGHRTAQKMKHVAFGKNAAVKQPSVRSLPFKTKHSITGVKKKPLRFQPLVRASSNCTNMATVRSAKVYEPSSFAARVRRGAGAPSKLRNTYTDLRQQHRKDNTHLLYIPNGELKAKGHYSHAGF